MLEQILDGLFFGFLIYMLTGAVFALLRSPRFYELVLLVAAPWGTHCYTNDFRTSLMALVFSGLFVVLTETAFQPERNRAAKKLRRSTVISFN
jgi:ABC-type Fe3+ transport system permease subunit